MFPLDQADWSKHQEDGTLHHCHSFSVCVHMLTLTKSGQDLTVDGVFYVRWSACVNRSPTSRTRRLIIKGGVRINYQLLAPIELNKENNVTAWSRGERLLNK